jgi:hypothetical protein
MRQLAIALIAWGLLLAPRLNSVADSTINPVNAHAWGGNLGWINWRGDVTNGAIIGESVCSGFIYSANAGWISIGGGAPADGVQYQNNSATDYGVNHDGLGNLRGLAWSANVGWLLFTNRDSGGAAFDAPKVDLASGRLSGFIFGANVGWISLSNAAAFVQTDQIDRGADSDGDGIPDSFEYSWSGGLTRMNATSDLDRDGSTDLQEYHAGTNPTDANDNLRVTVFSVSPGATQAVVTWTTSPTRFYHIQQRSALSPNTGWLDSGLGLIPPAGATTTRVISGGAAAERYFRIEAVPPLSP